MLSLTTVNNQIKDILSYDYSGESKPKAVRQKHRKKLKELNLYKAYLESSPTEDFLKNEVKRLSNRIELLMPESSLWSAMTNKQRLDFFKDNGITKMKKQIAGMNYIIRAK